MDNGCNLNQNCSAAGLVAQNPATFNACTNKQQAVETVDGCESMMAAITSGPYYHRLLADERCAGLPNLPMGMGDMVTG